MRATVDIRNAAQGWRGSALRRDLRGFLEESARRLAARLSRVYAAADAGLRRLLGRGKRWLRRFSIAPTPESPGARLSLWFGAVGFVCILATSMATAKILSDNITRTWIEQDEKVLTDFVQSAVMAHKAERLFHLAAEAPDAPPDAPMSAELQAMFQTIAGRDPVFLAHFYGKTRRIFWSSDPVFVGRTFDDNDELSGAFAGHVVTEVGSLDDFKKHEHRLVDPQRALFVETYIPVFDNGAQPIGVIEVYRTPAHLQRAINSTKSLIWTTTLLSGAVLYLTLGWIVRWGDQRLERSARELAESNSLAAIGEVATAVAHGLRNPLAAMRSSAELALDTPSAPHPPPAELAAHNRDQRDALREVVHQVDRLDQWIRALVGCLRSEALTLEPMDAVGLLRECVAGAEARARRAGLTLSLEAPSEPLHVMANRTAMLQVLECLVANAIEATPRGGAIAVRIGLGDASEATDPQLARNVVVEVQDTGRGPDKRIDPFAFFLTTKGSGLGVGLPIARRLVRRHDGALTLETAPRGGAVSRLVLPLAPLNSDQG